MRPRSHGSLTSYRAYLRFGRGLEMLTLLGCFMGSFPFFRHPNGPALLRRQQAVRWASALKVDAESVLPQVPLIPDTMLQSRGDLDLLTLVPWHIGNEEAALAAKLLFGRGRDNRVLVPVDPDRYAFPQRWEWVLAHDGRPNLRRKPSDCLKECVGDRYAGVAMVGISIWVQYGPRGLCMDLPASVFNAGKRRCCAFVDASCLNRPRLNLVRDPDIARADCGTPVFVRV